MSALVGVLALQGGVAEHCAALAALGLATRRVRGVNDLVGIDAIVLPGGESGVIDRLARGGLGEGIADAVRGGLPALGTCAGLVLLADELLNPAPGQRTFGGLDVAVRRNAFGSQVHSFEAAVDVAGLAAPVPGVFIRAPWVERVGEGVEVLASVPAGGAERTVAVARGPVLATAFHPELDADPAIWRLWTSRAGLIHSSR